jgi:hypothetical protein
VAKPTDVKKLDFNGSHRTKESKTTTTVTTTSTSTKSRTTASGTVAVTLRPPSKAPEVEYKSGGAEPGGLEDEDETDEREAALSSPIKGRGKRVTTAVKSIYP